MANVAADRARPTHAAPRSYRARLFQHSTFAVLLTAVALIVLRTLVYLLFEQISFDSDQALVGLMAKHLSQARAFPLFVYGQTYMLAVDAWTAAPFFLAAGATVAALRMSLLAWNVAFAVLLIAALRRDSGLPPWTALVPALFFVAAPASVASQLISAQGGIVAPFVYVAVLWFVRRRPLAFGIVLAIGFRHREFTLYAVVVLVLLEAATGEATRARVREWLITAVVFFATWESIEALKPFADYGGPGTRGQLLGGFSGSQIDNLVNRFDWQPAHLVERVTTLTPQILAWLTGARQVETALPIPPRPWLLWSAGVCLLFVTARALTLLFPLKSGTRSSQLARARFPLYILGVGVMSVAAFVAGKPVLEGYSRYVIYGLLVPIGVVSIVLVLEPRAVVRRAVMAATIAWATLAIADHTTVLVEAIRHPPPNPARQVADRLVAKHVPAAASGYWRAYLITFLARERVLVASLDQIRIQEYQDAFASHQQDAVRISDQPCPGGELVGRWYLCAP
jgi:hypothetical protein